MYAYWVLLWTQIIGYFTAHVTNYYTFYYNLLTFQTIFKEYKNQPNSRNSIQLTLAQVNKYKLLLHSGYTNQNLQVIFVYVYIYAKSISAFQYKYSSLLNSQVQRSKNDIITGRILTLANQVYNTSLYLFTCAYGG